MSTPQRTSSMDSNTSDNNTRKRVCKACDRCRLKKSKCDGANPCSRCKADNAICVFGERKKSHDKVYPKGYVEMLEQQQGQLVAGIRELYRRLQSGEGWSGLPLKEAHGGHPLTHDILERLDLLHPSGDSSPHYEGFEEDCGRMQQKLLENGAAYMQRRGSVSSDSEHDHTSSTSSYGTPPTKPLQFKEPFPHNAGPPTPPMHSPFPRQTQLPTVTKPNPAVLASQPYIRTSSELDPASILRSNYGAGPLMDDFMDAEYTFDSPMAYDPPAMPFNQYAIAASTANPVFAMGDWTDNSDLDFNSFINSSGRS